MEDDLQSTKVKFQKYINILLSEKLPVGEVEYNEKDVSLEAVGHLVNHLETFISTFPTTVSKSHVIAKLSELIVGFGLVNKFDTEDREFGPEDFPYTAKNAEKCLEYLKILLKEVRHLENAHLRQFLNNVLLLWATHSKSYHWSSDTSINLSNEFLECLLGDTKHRNLSSLLCEESFHPTIFKGILKKMRPSLMKDTWMQNPSSCYIFFTLLQHVKHPHLIDYLPDIFPPPFMFVSYPAVPQQVIGIQCFNHLLDNVPPTYMKLDGKEDAIYHSLFPLTYSIEFDIVTVLFPCLLKLPMMISQKAQPVFWGKFDQIFNHLLFEVEMISNVKIKRIFLTHILSFAEWLPPFKHLKRIMNIVKQTINDGISPDNSSQITALKILRTVIKSCWPRMTNYCFEILVLILEFQEKYSADCDNFDEINQLCEECIILLKRATSEKFQSLTRTYVEECTDLPGAEFLRNAIVKESY